jgi:hypothetical protein
MDKFEIFKIKNTLIYIVKLLQAKQWKTIYNLDFRKEILPDEIEESLRFIESDLDLLPKEELDRFDFYETKKQSEIIVEVNLWYNNQRSDYTLSCVIKNNSKSKDTYDFSIDSIHIL